MGSFPAWRDQAGISPDLASWRRDLDGKRLELLKEAFPKVARLAFLWVPVDSRETWPLTEMEAAAKALGVKLQSLDVRSLDDFDSAFARANREGAQALIATASPLINTQQRQVLDFAAKNRLPAMYETSEFVEAGGLMSYAPNFADLWRRAADYVDKILKVPSLLTFPSSSRENLSLSSI